MRELMRKLHQPTEIAPKPRKQKNHKEPDETGSQIIMEADSSARARLQPPSSYKDGNSNDEKNGKQHARQHICHLSEHIPYSTLLFLQHKVIFSFQNI